MAGRPSRKDADPECPGNHDGEGEENQAKTVILAYLPQISEARSDINAICQQLTL